MTSSPLLNRRFVRLQAVQHFYAFYVCKQANYDWALEQIQADFIPDVFSDPPVDKARLAQEAQQAIALFNASLTTSETFPPGFAHVSSRVNATVSRVVINYKSEMAKDRRWLEQGLVETMAIINQACVRIWQLLFEWAHLSRKQTENAKLIHPYSMTTSACLADSYLLQRLKNDHNSGKRVRQEAADWQDYMPLVSSWYNQFVKKDLTVQQYLSYLSNPTQEKRLLVFLINNIILDKEEIQAFFSDSYLKWEIYKPIVKKLVHQGLSRFIMKNPEQELNLDILGEMPSWASEQYFYSNLVDKTLQKDAELEALIAQKAKNWAIDRIVLLDKIIMKLALCEMLYFTNIPVKVSMNEYIDLSKIYSMPRSSQFINGLLDAVAATLHQGGSTKA